MATMRIECEGLTVKECGELAAGLESRAGVEQVVFRTATNNRADIAISASAEPVQLVVKLALEGAAVKVGSIALQRFYDKVGKVLVDGAWEWMKRRLSGKSDVEIEVTLFDADGNQIKSLKRRR